MLELHDVIIKPLRHTLSLTVEDGRMACLSGPKGTGKTTVLRAVMGGLPIDGGHISIDGELLTPLSAPYFRRNMGYVPSILRPIPGQDRVGDVRHLLFGLEANRQLAIEQDHEEEERLWDELTPAEQYLELVMCVSRQERRLLLIDEPAASLDWQTQQTVIDVMRRMAARGTALLVVSNEPMVKNLTNNVISLL